MPFPKMPSWSQSQVPFWVWGGGFVVAAGLGAAVTWWGLSERHVESPTVGSPSMLEQTAASEAASTSGDSPETEITLPSETWKAAGIRIAPASRGSLAQSVRVTGKIALNEDRVAHVFPLVEGRVKQVAVQFGERVQAGDVLAVVQSREVGQAKLDLYHNRLLRQFAEIKNEYTQETTRNTQALIAALEKGESMDDIEREFRDRPMGEHREQLLSAYASRHKSRADLERLVSLSDQGITSGKQLTAAQAARDADQATFQAWLEQIKHESHHEALLAQQALQEAETRVFVDEASLKILGYDAVDLANIDPAQEGDTLSDYPVKAPFDGVILSKDMVLLERVRPDSQLLSIADLSTVWVMADVYEQHLPLVQDLAGKTVHLQSNAWPNQVFEAQVFSTGEVVDESSRTIALRAVAENAERMLKPGMFVDIELPGSAADVLQVPATAIQEHEGQSFVFVQTGEDTFERRPVTVGRQSDGAVEIVQGLNSGEPVAAQGGFALKSRMLAGLLSED